MAPTRILFVAVSAGEIQIVLQQIHIRFEFQPKICNWNGSFSKLKMDLPQTQRTDFEHVLVFTTLKPEQNRCHFAGSIFKCIVFNENIEISIRISLNSVSKSPV